MREMFPNGFPGKKKPKEETPSTPELDDKFEELEKRLVERLEERFRAFEVPSTQCLYEPSPVFSSCYQSYGPGGKQAYQERVLTAFKQFCLDHGEGRSELTVLEALNASKSHFSRISRVLRHELLVVQSAAVDGQRGMRQHQEHLAGAGVVRRCIRDVVLDELNQPRGASGALALSLDEGDLGEISQTRVYFEFKCRTSTSSVSSAVVMHDVHPTARDARAEALQAIWPATNADWSTDSSRWTGLLELVKAEPDLNTLPRGLEVFSTSCLPAPNPVVARPPETQPGLEQLEPELTQRVNMDVIRALHRDFPDLLDRDVTSPDAFRRAFGIPASLCIVCGKRVLKGFSSTQSPLPTIAGSRKSGSRRARDMSSGARTSTRKLTKSTHGPPREVVLTKHADLSWVLDAPCMTSSGWSRTRCVWRTTSLPVLCVSRVRCATSASPPLLCWRSSCTWALAGATRCSRLRSPSAWPRRWRLTSRRRLPPILHPELQRRCLPHPGAR
ncbi:hypothetical protein J8273_6793 [Carpediemonas membranifera]|uniref:Uncharacterized protein n=1 Tax=Carpediemonas membranifera TaxID=201153 RepID=A0A8J6AUI0_9EUKA|nr:hypothetical protein J8273_6793 [Carpediemonas membranifera]|eukprot:KAG9391905.1 hypothetical protein J8273_6793 [Carpediemonas membranifera]